MTAPSDKPYMAEIERAKQHASDQVKSLMLQRAELSARIEQLDDLIAEYARIANIDVPRPTQKPQIRKEA